MDFEKDDRMNDDRTLGVGRAGMHLVFVALAAAAVSLALRGPVGPTHGRPEVPHG